MIDVVDVALDSRVAGHVSLLTYLNSDRAVAGQCVLAPLGARTVLGLVVANRKVKPDDLPVSESRMKAIASIVRGVDIPPAHIELAKFLANEFLVSPSAAVSLCLPPGLKDRLVSTWLLTRPVAPGTKLTPVQDEVVRVLSELPDGLAATKSRPITAALMRALRSLKRLGIADEQLTIAARIEKSSLPDRLRLNSDAARIEQFLVTEGRKKPAQALTLLRLQGSDGAEFSPSEIKALSGVTDQTIRALLNANLIEKVEGEAGPSAPAHRLNAEQEAAFAAIRSAVLGGKSKGFLLWGVTGSGKTEVYLRSAAEALKQGRQVLYLVPEIALTAQVIGQLRSRFGTSVAVVHSNQTASERLDTWVNIRDGKSPIVLGARSAIFAPLERLGLIIVDEEHEQTFKQESYPRYQAKTLAKELARLHHCPLVLGSATPSIETFWQAQTGELELLKLEKRTASATLPSVEILDLTQQYQQTQGKPSVISPPLKEAITQTLSRNEQVILLLNRRAYAPFLSCRDCGQVMTCPSCAVSLSFHKKAAMLVCHYCDHRQPAPDACPSCESTRISPTGAGTEKVEEVVRTEFPEARVARLDRDVAKKKGVLEETIAQMRAGELDILVGTQMVAKGLDFPNVTLVGVIVADTALHLPDFRASERAFQLLSQVAGRAGRGSKPGRVFIQTFSPEHPAVLMAQSHDYLPLYNAVLEEREEVGYPPFNRLVNIVFSGENASKVRAASAKVGEALQIQCPQMQILGPVDCSIERLNNQWRRHILVKAMLGESLGPVGKVIEESEFDGVSIAVDVDPYTMM